LACLLALIAFVVWSSIRESAPEKARPTAAAPEATPALIVDTTPASRPVTDRAGRDYLSALKSLERLRAPLAKEKARPKEAVIVFRDPDAYRRFLARAVACGFKVLAKLDGLNAVRIGYDSLADLASDMAANAADYGDLDANFLVSAPEVPTETDPRFDGKFTPFGSDKQLFDFLGIEGDTSKWGNGVTIAILDSGVAADPTFGTNRVRYIDIGQGVFPLADNGHGTAVASLAGGMDPMAMGTAPGSNLLSIRVTGTDGLSDSFTIAQALVAAVDAGAQVVNISMGSYGNTAVMTNAVTYATSRGVMIVASAGNDQVAQLTWPAADPRVISVGGVDLSEQQVIFSNSGDNLQISAPGLGLPSAWTNNQRVLMDGTSGSAPLVAGSIAAMMSQNPGLSPVQAWQLLRTYSSDGGTPGPDPNFGAGILNVGWAMNRNNYNRIDTAVSSQFFDPTTLEMQFVVQNRSARGVGGLELDVNTTVGAKDFSVPWLGPGGIYSVRMPVDYQTLRAYGRADYTATLINPPGLIDAIPANNQRNNRITVVGAQ
jgi:hypothetical protein